MLITSIDTVRGHGAVEEEEEDVPGLSRRPPSAGLCEATSTTHLADGRTCTVVLFPTWRPVELILAPGIAF